MAKVNLQVPTSKLVSLWEISETVEQLKEMLPATIWENDLPKYKRALHQKQFLASRLLCVDLAEQYNVPFTGVIKNEYNEPFLARGYPISISHSENYAAICACKDRTDVGIDIQHYLPKLFRIEQRMFTPEESAWVNGDLKRLCAAWSAKEAAYKYYGKRGLDFTEHIKIVSFDEGQMQVDLCYQDYQKLLTLDVNYFDDFCMVYNR